MNHLLNLGFLFACTTAVTSLSAQDKPKDLVEVVFTKDMDKADLDSIQQYVKPLGVDLQINSTEYKDGLLQAIDFNISTASGSGTANGEIRPDRKLGFRYYPNGGSMAAFEVGTLDAPGHKEK